jgi:hypothetical protein
VAAGIGGLVLILALFLPWYSPSGFGSANGFEVSKFIDFVLLLIGLVAAGVALMEMTGSRVNLPFGLPRALQVLGIVATTFTFGALVEGNSQGFGLFLALLGGIAILTGGILAERSPEKTVTIGGGRPAGGYGPPPGGPGGPGGYGPPPGGFGPPPAGPGGFQQPPAGPGTPATVAQPIPAPAPPAPAGPPPPPAGGTPDWYPDPHGQKRLRYFDGNQWTEHVAD